MKLRSRYSAQPAAAGSEGHAVPVPSAPRPALAQAAPVAVARACYNEAMERHMVPVRSLSVSAAATVALLGTVRCNDRCVMQHLSRPTSQGCNLKLRYGVRCSDCSRAPLHASPSTASRACLVAFWGIPVGSIQRRSTVSTGRMLGLAPNS